jgi:membrane protein implicated in regulation of membrane protease activity
MKYLKAAVATIWLLVLATTGLLVLFGLAWSVVAVAVSLLYNSWFWVLVVIVVVGLAWAAADERNKERDIRGKDEAGKSEGA